MPTSSRLPALTLLLALAASGCDRREHDCAALRHVVDRAPATAGGSAAPFAPFGDVAADADRAVADVDRAAPRNHDLAGMAADYRAAMVATAAAARGVEAAAGPLVAAMAPIGEAPSPGLDAAVAAVIEKDVTALATPCVEGMFAGLSTLFQKKEAGPDGGSGASPAPRRVSPDCEALGSILGRVMEPGPQESVSALLLTCAGALEGAELTDPALRAAARSLAVQVRRIEPALRRVRVPAAELLSLGRRLTEARAALDTARADAEAKAGDLRRACPVARAPN